MSPITIKEAPPGWTAIILAGQRPGPDPLANHFGKSWKALVEVAGEPMLARVVRALADTAKVSRTLVLCQEPEALRQAAETAGPVVLLASQTGISESLLRVAGTAEAPWPVLVTTADHPLLTPAFISAFLANSSGCDLAIGMVERKVMRAAYPDNQRTWLKFRDGHWSGANLFALNSDAARHALLLWADAEQDRKRAWKLFLHFGPWLAFRALTRTIGLHDALRIAGARMGMTARLVPLPDAETAIDVDKPSDHALAERILAARTLSQID